MKLPGLLFALTALALPAGAQDIVGGLPTQNFRAVGIGVQVAPDWVMTVQHAAIGVGGTYGNGYGARTVAAVYTFADAAFPANDIALLRLVPDGSNNSYPPVASEVFRPGGFRPLDVTIASPSNHVPRGMGLTVATEAIPFYDDDGPGPLGPVPVNWLVTWDTTVHVESGDSGGGLFLGHVRDSSVLLGLTSALITDDAGAPLASAFVQPAAYKAWIDGIMHADLADEQMLNWASVGEVPEPAAWMLGAAGLLLLAARRRP